MATPDEIAEEQKNMRKLRTIVDLTSALLFQGNLSTQEALTLIKSTKKSVLHLFPEDEETFDLIYKKRFERILKEQLKSN